MSYDNSEEEFQEQQRLAILKDAAARVIVNKQSEQSAIADAVQRDYEEREAIADGSAIEDEDTISFPSLPSEKHTNPTPQQRRQIEAVYRKLVDKD